LYFINYRSNAHLIEKQKNKTIMKNSNSTHLIIGFIITIITLGIGYLLFSNRIKKDEQILTSKLDELFGGKSAVADGQKTFLTGQLSQNRRDYSLLAGGFNAYELTKESDGFVKKQFNAGDLHFNKDEYFYSNGFKLETFRPNVQSCYDGAFEYLLQGNEKTKKTSYSPNKFVDIKNFPQGYSSDFYSIEIAIHPKELYQTSRATGRVYTSVFEVNYSQINEYYAMVENKDAKNKSMLAYMISSLGIGLILSFFAKPLAKFLQPNPEASNSIFSKKWKNINTNFIMSFEVGTRGNNKVLIVEEGKIKKGIMKFTENGKNIHISLSDTEYYFQIDKLTDNIIEVLDLASGKIEQFEVLGSGALIKQQKEEKNIEHTKIESENDVDENE
jgi:hypothetical protein